MTAATELRAARERSGLSLRELASRAGVAASTVWRIEAGRLDPTVGMLSRLMAATEPRQAEATRETMVSLALGRWTAAALLREPTRVLAKGRGRVAALLADPGLPSTSRRWLSEWDQLLDGPLVDVVGALLDPTERGYELRQHTPFTGVLDEKDRVTAIRQATAEHRETRSA